LFVRGIIFPSLKYNNQTQELDVFDGRLDKAIDFYLNRLARQENVHTGDEVNLWEFPVPKWHELDGGRYIGTSDVVIVKDPDSDCINLGTYRMQLYDDTSCALFISPGKHANIMRQKYFERGLPVALEIGKTHGIAVHRGIVVRGNVERRNHILCQHAAERGTDVQTLGQSDRREELANELARLGNRHRIRIVIIGAGELAQGLRLIVHRGPR